MENHPRLESIHDEALAWINSSLAALNQAPVSELSAVRETAWSLVAEARQGTQRCYFKYLPAQYAHEIAVSEYSVQRCPDHCAPVVASDRRRRFLLVADAGPSLRDALAAAPDPTLWLALLPHYAQLQIDAMTDPALADLGLPDRRLHRLPELISPHLEALRTVDSHAAEDRFGPEHEQWVRRAFASWSDWMTPLYRHGITDTLNHGDLHDGNIAVTTHPSTGEQRPQLFDWGDACYSHPFMSLRTLLVSAESRLGFQVGDPNMNRLITAYLTPWQQFASQSDLWDMVQAALRVAPLITFLNWQWALQNQQDPRAQAYQYALPALLREFVDAQSKRWK